MSIEKSLNQVRSLYDKLIDGWNLKNAKAYAGVFTEDANVVGFDGSQMNGRLAIEQELTQIFQNFPTGEFTTVIEEVRMINQNTVLLRALAGMIPRGYKDINPNVNAIQTLVATEDKGEWKISLFQNTPAAFHGRPELQEEVSAKLRETLKNPSTRTH